MCVFFILSSGLSTKWQRCSCIQNHTWSPDTNTVSTHRILHSDWSAAPAIVPTRSFAASRRAQSDLLAPQAKMAAELQVYPLALGTAPGLITGTQASSTDGRLGTKTGIWTRARDPAKTGPKSAEGSGGVGRPTSRPDPGPARAIRARSPPGAQN